jgi:hypothetical protein
MIKRPFEKVVIAVALPLAVAGALYAGVSNNNGPQNGSGGNAQSNGMDEYCWILHAHGNGNYSLMKAKAGALAGHASHGDLWYKTGCPLTGAVDACE